MGGCAERQHWVSFNEALEMFDFQSEPEVVEKAREMIEERSKKWESGK